MAPSLPAKVLLLSSLFLATYGAAIYGDVESKIVHCDTIVARGTETGDGGAVCFMEMLEKTEKREAVIEELGASLDLDDGDPDNSTVPLDIDSVAGPVICANRVPSSYETGRLCSGTVPTSVTLPPAYSSTRARCYIYTYRSAVFLICNSDRCSSSRFTGQRSVCNRIYNRCRRSNKGGYVRYTAPNGLSSLYRKDTSARPPLYSNC